MSRLQEKYKETIHPDLMKKFGFTNRLQAPKVAKITVSMGVGRRGVESKAAVKARRRRMLRVVRESMKGIS